MAEPLERKATRYEDSVRRLFAIWRWGSRERVLAIVGFAAFAAAAALPLGLSRLPAPWRAAIPQALKYWLTLALWLAGGLCLGMVAFRLYRRVTAPLPQGETKLPALKGAASFTSAEDDVELFAQLCRDEELERLRAAILDDQTPLIALLGESGVGKTSLLRAGLAHALKKDGIEIIYWEALPTNPDTELLHRIRTAWGKVKGAPADFAALPAAIAASSRVVVLDQFEQLSAEAHPAIFTLLREVLQTPPPFRGTWIIALREEYLGRWWTSEAMLDLPKAVRNRITLCPLRRFSTTDARRVVAVLASAAQLPIDQAVVDALVDSVAVGGTVSPVDLGVTLLGLGELTGGEGASRVSAGDFQASGGPAWLLTRYLERQMAFFSPAQRGELLLALLALADRGQDQRLAEGLSLAELAEKAHPLSLTDFHQALDFFASSRVRVLEPLEEARYRLIHERFIAPLQVLSGSILAEAALASRRLAEGYRIWSNDRRSRFLLSGAELRLVLRHQGEFPWGKDETAKRDFVRQSQRRRSMVRSLAAVAMLGVLALGAVALHWQQRQELALELRSFNLPEDLGDYLSQLDELAIGTNVAKFDWLSRATRLRKLSVQAHLDAPTPLPQSLKSFTCIGCSNVHEFLLPPHLQELDIFGSSGPIADLPATLKSIILTLSPMGGVDFRRLPAGLRSILIDVGTSRVSEITLPSGLTSLRLVSPMNLTNLLWVPRGVESLHFEIGSDSFRFDGVPPALKLLTVNYAANRSRANDLQSFPRELTSLTIGDLSYGLPPERLDFRDLRALKYLDIQTVNCFGAQFPASLRSLGVSTDLLPSVQLPKSLEQLSLRDGQLSNLKSLPRGLKSLNLSYVRVPSWEGLPRSLRSLSLDSVESQAPIDVEVLQNLDSLILVGTTLPPKHLPPHLQSLVFTGQWQWLRGNLPATLQSLSLMDKMDRLGDLGNLPPNLKELTIPAAVKDLRGLPKSVRILRLR